MSPDRPRFPAAPDPTPEELARRRATSRRTGRIIALFCVALGVGAAAILLSLDPAEDDSTSVVENGPDGTVTYEVTSRSHVTTDVDYGQTPPVGGDHNPTWWNCDAYDEPIVTEAAVHSLEHGAVWVTYRSDLDPDQVDLVAGLADDTFVLVSPWSESTLPAPIVLSAWGVQLEVQQLPSPEANAFVRAYRQAPSAPEPGAPCTGGAPG